MRYTDIRRWTQDLTPKGKVRKRSADLLKQVKQPPATPARPPTGERGDFQGNVYEAHRTDRFGAHGNLRDINRANRSGRGAIQFQRSRIQRARRKQRTGGVR